jgi:hypothetical protein
VAVDLCLLGHLAFVLLVAFAPIPRFAVMTVMHIDTAAMEIDTAAALSSLKIVASPVAHNLVHAVT